MEQEQVSRSYAETMAAKDDILAAARKRHAARRAESAALRDVMQLLRAERDRQGLSLADMRERTGMERSSLSKLENDSDANPTLSTVCRYAEALGVRIEIRLAEAPEMATAAP